MDFSESTTDGSKSNDVPAEFFNRFFKSNDKDPNYGQFAPAEDLWKELSSPQIFLSNKDTRIKESIHVDNESNPEIVTIAKYAYTSINPGLSSGSSLAYVERMTKNDANWVFYRVSDMMLIKAEALICMMGEEESERNDSLGQAAFDLIKAIADRSAPNTSSSLVYSNYSTKSQLMDLVFDERRREFLFEGKRWFDLVRHSRRDGNTEYLVEAVQNKFTENAATATGKLKNIMAMYWPYNYDELQVNSNLKQNPAYPEAGDSYESTNK